MCNINAWFPGKTNIRNHMLAQYWYFCEESARSNKDGFGLWIENNIYKWETKNIPSLLSVHKTLIKQPYIITHQRLATSGKGKDMMHPYRFTYKDKGKFRHTLTGIHNGIMVLPFTYNEKLYSDSYMFFRSLVAELSKHETKTTAQIIEALYLALRELLPTITGSYSILLSIDECFFYFRKNRIITCYEFHGGLYFSTNARPSLEKGFSWEKEKKNNVEVTIKQDTLYRILPDIAELVEVGSLAVKVKQQKLDLAKLSEKAIANVVKDSNVTIDEDDIKTLRKITQALIKIPGVVTSKDVFSYDLVSEWFMEMSWLLFGEEPDEAIEEIFAQQIDSDHDHLLNRNNLYKDFPNWR